MHKSHKPTCLWSIFAFTMFAGMSVSLPAHGAQVTVEPLKDATLYEDALGQTANGSGDFFFAGTTQQPLIRRGVLAFDLSSIPPGSIINSAVMTLYMSRTTSGAQTVTVHRVLADWGEGASNAGGNEGGGAAAELGDATWIHTFADDTFWALPGGDFSVSASAAQSVVGIGSYSWSSPGIVADVGTFVDNPSTNFGWMLIGNEDTFGTAKRFDSRTRPDVNLRPALAVDFSLPPSTGACCQLDGTCLLLLDTNCSSQGGTYQGDGALCDPNPCPQPAGACCFGDFSCQVLGPNACTATGGTYLGNDTVCTGDPCGALVGACCLNNATCAALSLLDCQSQGGAYHGFGSVCVPDLCPWVLTPYVDALPIPAVATPVSGTPGGVATYDISARQFTQQLHAELPPTTVWGYGDGPTGGTYPGPTIEATRDELVTVTWRNDLRDELGNLRTNHYLDVDLCPHGAEDAAKMVVHLHGGHVPAEFDGYPESTYLPGAFAVYEYPNHQLPATLWYHDHAMGITRLNVYMGMAAFYLIRDSLEIDLGLPSGEFEIPMAIQDRSFNVDGSWKYPSIWQGSFFGDHMLVNGKVWPHLNVKQGKYRFRMLNGCNARTLALSLSTGAPFQVIGGDAGLLQAPQAVTQLVLTPAERADLILDFAAYPPGTEILLTNSAPAPYPGSPGAGVIPQVMKFIVTAAAGHTDAIPATLRPFEPLAEQDAEQVRDFMLATTSDPCTGIRWAINGLGWNDITEQPVLDTSEVWRFINPTGISHPMHMHLVSFQVLDSQAFAMIDGEVVPIGTPVPPPPHLAGWKDTVEVAPNQIVRVIARFEDYLGRFAYHCHILEHEDHEMMRQFETIECTTNAHCNDGQFCNGIETCDANNTCIAGTPMTCEDLYACTVDYCDPLALDGAGACFNVPDSALCDNGVFCDGRESCSFLLGCVDASAPCDPALSCDEALGACTGCTADGQCDNGDPCTADTCDAGVCVSIPTYNQAAQCCTPGTGATNPIDDGDPCTTDSCDAVTGAVAHMPQAGLCAAGLGSRYLRIRPASASGTPIAILITGDAISGGTCFQKYVQAGGPLGDTPAFQTPGQWGNVDAYGLDIIPERQYTIQLDDGASLSTAIIASTWRFGDVDGNDVVNFSDVQQVVLIFQGIAPHTPAGDMKPCVPNGVINFEDIFAAVQGFQSVEYVGASCADPCP